MRYLALACDYDGTLAEQGHVDDETIAALERFRRSGRKVILVTGRELTDLTRVFPRLHLFDRIVAENGAVLYDPGSRDLRSLGEPPPDAFVHELERRGVAPLVTGRVIVATSVPHDQTVVDVIRSLGLELHVIFNKGSVMVLPSGINKATGLARALDDLRLSPHNAVGIGDAENDHAMLAACECGVAVANALESVKARVDLVTKNSRGAGVVETVDRILATDLAELAPRLTRHDLHLGRSETGEDVCLPPFGGALLAAGPSGAGKTTVITTLLERLYEAGYQFCVLDPEGDHHDFTGAIALRGGDRAALAGDVVRVLERPSDNAVANLLDLRLDDRPEFLQLLLPRLLEMRAATGRPHWLVIDEAHHLLPSSWQHSDAVVPSQLQNLVLVTVHPDHVARAALNLVESLIVVGREPQATLDAFGRGRGEAAIRVPTDATDGQLAWFVRPGEPPLRFRGLEPTADRRRHRRKYAQGELGVDRSFYFRGPEGRLNLRAQNLELFTQLADGVDDETWRFHLRRGDVSRWFRDVIKDEALAAEAAEIESSDLPSSESRARIREAIRSRYTTPP